MGMFDTVRSSYDLGPQFTNVELQTKEIEDDYSGTLTDFWISPDGYLWYGDYKGTSTFEVIEEDDPRYDPDRHFLNFEWVPTGQKGKYRIHPITKYVTVYTAQWDGAYEDWPRCRIHFKCGKIVEYEHVTRND